MSAKTLTFLLFLFLGIYLLQSNPVTADSTSYLDSQVQSLRSRVSRLESQVRSLSRSETREVPSLTPPESYSNPGVTDPEMFDRLAILVIEIKEDLKALEGRLNKLEETFNY